MSFLKNKWTLIALAVLCWAVATSFLAGYYYLQYNDLSSKVTGKFITANLGLNYGNGSGVIWFNNTRMSSGSTLLILTNLVGSVNYTESLTQEAFVNSINGVANKYPNSWLWWSSSSYGWIFGSVASNRYVVGENETLLWDYQNVTTFPPPSPT